MLAVGQKSGSGKGWTLFSQITSESPCEAATDPNALNEIGALETLASEFIGTKRDTTFNLGDVKDDPTLLAKLINLDIMCQ